MTTRRDAIGALGALAAGAVPGSAGAGDEAEIARIEREMVEAAALGDVAVLKRLFAADYIHTNFIGGRATKREEIDGFYDPRLFKLASGEVANLIVHRHGETAIAWGDITWRGASYTPPNGQPVDLSGVYAFTRVYRKTSEGWRVLASHASRKPPAPRP